MDLERAKQLRNEYTERYIVSKEQFERFKKVFTSNGIKEVTPPEDCSWEREVMHFYAIKKDGMTHQERRAYLRMVAKKKKVVTLLLWDSKER